jgi:O-antigen ligase
MIKNHWLIGIGPGNYQEKYLDYQKYYPPYLEWAVPHPHNLYLAFWLYGGIAGLIGFLSLIFLWFKGILPKIKSGPDWTALVSLGIMAYILTHGLIDTTYFKNDLAVIFWLCFIVLKKH